MKNYQTAQYISLICLITPWPALSITFRGMHIVFYRQKNYSEVCKNCREAYKTLSSLYSEMQKMNELENKAEPGTHLCIDVEDAMNITRKLWSRTFNCSVPCSDTVPVIAVSVFILFLPVVFYLSSFLHSEQKKRKLILPKRLKSSTSFANIQENSNWDLQNGELTYHVNEWWKTQLDFRKKINCDLISQVLKKYKDFRSIFK